MLLKQLDLKLVLVPVIVVAVIRLMLEEMKIETVGKETLEKGREKERDHVIGTEGVVGIGEIEEVIEEGTVVYDETLGRGMLTGVMGVDEVTLIEEGEIVEIEVEEGITDE